MAIYRIKIMHLEQTLLIYISLVIFTQCTPIHISVGDFTYFLSVLIFTSGGRYKVKSIAFSTLTNNVL